MLSRFFDHPALLLLLLLLVPVVALGMYSLATLSPVRRWLAIALRAAALIVLVFMLAGMHWSRWHDELAVVVVIDESESVRRFARPPSVIEGSPNNPAGGEEVTVEQWARQWVKASSKSQRPDDYSGLITFSGTPTVQSMPDRGLNFDVSTVNRGSDGSAIGGGVRQGFALFPQDVSKRMLVISDGNENDKTGRRDADGNGFGGSGGSDLLAAAWEAKAAGVPIDVLPIEYKVDNEVMVQGVYAPSEARDGQTVAIRVVLRGTKATAGSLFLKHDGMPVDLNGANEGTGVPISEKQWAADAEADSSTGQFICVRMIEVPLALSGANKFQAIFEPTNKTTDTMASNNQAETFTLVHGKGRILFLDNVGGDPGAVLPNALASHGILLDVVSGRDLPGSLAELQRFDGIILQNVPAEMIMPAQQKMLARYVNDMGGGLIMVGGPDSFGAGGWTNTPVDQLLPVNCQVPNQTVLPTGALVLIIDRSGSMDAGMPNSHVTNMVVANEAAVLALNTLYPQDLVGVIAFDHESHWIAKVQPNTNPVATAKLIRKIHTNGGTNIYPSLVMAYEALAPIKTDSAALKHVILLTDGQSQEGKYYEIVGKMAKAGITLSTVGVGNGVDAALLQQLAQMGGGTYHPVIDANRMPQIFIKEARSIRKNLIKETTFKPQLASTGSPIMTGIKAVPDLKGLVLTGPKNDPRVYMPMLGPEGEPLFAHWQVGLGRTAAFTSDATNRWATPWLSWGGYGDFWSRTVRAVARPSASRDYDLLTTIRHDNLHIRLDASTGASGKGAGAFMNFLQVEGSVLKPDGNVQPVKLSQTGPGIYEADVPALDQGNYIVSLLVHGKETEPSMVFGGSSHAAGAELRQFSSNRAILEQVAQITGGRVLDPKQADPEAVFNREGVKPSYSVRPLWRPLLAALLAIFLLDVAVRRIAWDFAAMWQSVKRWLSAAAGTMSPRRDEAPATLAALKARAAQVGDRLTPAGEERAGRAPGAVSASRKFEAAPDEEADEDFTAAVGGAKAVGASELAAAARAAKPASEGQTTSRLLDAKRRARKNMNDPGPGE